MRILIVNTYYAPEIIGGAEYSVKKLAEGLKNRGHEVRVLCTGDKYAHEVIDGVDVVRIRVRNVCRVINAEKSSKLRIHLREIQDIWNPLNMGQLNKEMHDFSPDVIHTNGLYDITPVIWKVANKLGIRVVHTLRDYFLTCPQVSFSCNGKHPYCKYRIPLCLLHQTINREQTKRVNYVTAPSAITLNKLIENGFFKGVPNVVIPNATDYNSEEVKSIYNERHSISTCDKVKFVFLGTLNENKGLLWLLDEFNKFTDDKEELYIAGKGKLLTIVKEACEMNHNIHYCGFLDEAGITELLRKCDVLICPSIWEEPFGRVVLDAYKNALPVIANCKGALPELVKDGKTGIVVDNQRPNSLYDAMYKYISNYELILSHREQCFDELQKYSLIRQLEQFECIYFSESR